jgi:hypothetical protein
MPDDGTTRRASRLLVCQVHPDYSVEGGRFVTKRSAKGMIEPTASEKPQSQIRSSLDEARLRQQAIGVKLRQMFDDVVAEPVPDEFLDILRRADEKSRAGGG